MASGSRNRQKFGGISRRHPPSHDIHTAAREVPQPSTTQPRTITSNPVAVVVPKGHLRNRLCYPSAQGAQLYERILGHDGHRRRDLAAALTVTEPTATLRVARVTGAGYLLRPGAQAMR